MDFFNPNVAGEMAQLLLNTQDKYVPKVELDEGPKVVTAIPLIGDQLFEERARNVKWTYQNGDNDVDCINGLRAEFADWHAKVTLYEVCKNIFLYMIDAYIHKKITVHLEKIILQYN